MSEKDPCFSVIIPTKDRPDMLARALRSVLQQHDVGFEVIVADDGDGRGAALARDIIQDGRLDAFVTGRLGQVPARNSAIRRASAPWIAYLDDDDWWADPGYLAAMAAVLRNGEALAYGSGRIVREGPDVSPDDWVAFQAHIDATSIRSDNTLLISGIAYPKSFHDRLGLFDETFKIYWDWDWYLRLIEAGIRMTAGNSAGVCISTRIDNVSAGANAALRQAELERFARKHGLTGLVLKNHEIIAMEQAGDAETSISLRKAKAP